MLEKFKYQILKDFPDFGSKKLYVAISGGKDSMVLSHLLQAVGHKHVLLHCNFQLRGEESDQDEHFIRKYAETNNLELHVKTFDTKNEINNSGLSLQETARNLRYDWFESFNTNDIVLILTAHHLDDSIETFFINLLRGTGIKGISGIPKNNTPYYRPLTHFTSEEIFKYIDDNQIDYREDSSNATSKYRRNNLRHGLIPDILELEPQFKTKMGSFFEEINTVKEFIRIKTEELRTKLLDSENSEISVLLSNLQGLDDYSIQLLFEDRGVRRANLTAFLRFLDSETGAIFSTENAEFLVNRDTLIIRESSYPASFSHTVSKLPAIISFPSGKIKISFVAASEFTLGTNPQFIDHDKVQFPLNLRSWKHRDRITPLGLNGSKLVSDILIDKKLSAFEKERVLILEDASSSILMILGYTVSEHFKMESYSKQLISISTS